MAGKTLTPSDLAAAPAPRSDQQAPCRPHIGDAALPCKRRVPSTELFLGATVIEIVHDDQVYRLRQTALGKLILTK